MFYMTACDVWHETPHAETMLAHSVSFDIMNAIIYYWQKKHYEHMLIRPIFSLAEYYLISCTNPFQECHKYCLVNVTHNS